MSIKILKITDNFLDRITMYRLVLYVLIAFVVIASLFGAVNLIPYSFTSILISTILLVVFSWISNYIFSKVFEAPTNIESVYITALILALIISPAKSVNDIIFLAWAAIWANASKYIFAIRKKHIFNPAAISVVLTAAIISQSASWWVGTAVMSPFVIVGGFLVVRKIRRFDMVYGLIMTVLITSFVFAALKGSDVFTTVGNVLFRSSLPFFALIMFTEPLTTPPTSTLQILYGILVGFLFVPQVHLGNLHFTPELALIVGNIFSYLVSPKEKLILSLKDRIRVAPDVFDFVFKPEKIPAFSAGQYMEWTLPHKNPDIRGNRRYFTIASSPTEDVLRLGIKFYQNGSSFKRAMLSMKEGSAIVGNQLAGDFTLPKDKNKKLVFIAGGIGITPFRSIIKYLLDKKEKRQIVLFYSNKYVNEFVYNEILRAAGEELGIKSVYTLSDAASVPFGWTGKVGRIDNDMIITEVPDYKERIFYLSGPRVMVTSFNDMLINMGISKDRIKIDFFPGFV